LIEDNSYSGECAPAFSNKLDLCCVIVEINNAAQSVYKPALRGKTEQTIFVVTFVFKGITMNKKWALIMTRSGLLKRASSSGTGI
jgi:hypothetical protein